ncbi:MAG: hypothetical protein KME12_16040 [Trichocoleus desertorum ATA4-8-CV12]|jgi:hypothetical protein|nr:hypothetical protein [Trichocoleus desertorum ATA4-8-CV12]
MKTVMDQHEINQLGSSLQKIDQTLIRSDQSSGVTRLWYQGREPYFDVVFELQNHDLVWFQLTLRGKSLSWNQKSKNVQTGMTNERQVNDTTYYSGSKLIQTNHTVDQNFVQLVRAILQTRVGELVFDQALALLNQRTQS